jgi:hypothetical protein
MAISLIDHCLDHLDKTQIVARNMIPTTRNMVIFTISRFGSSGSVDL